MKKLFITCACAMLTISSFAGVKRIKSMRKAEILASRNLVETVYGIKIKFNESVSNIIDGVFEGSVKSKTGQRRINGIKYEEKVYDKCIKN